MKTTYKFVKNGVNTTYEVTAAELEKLFKAWLLDHTKDEQKLKFLLANSTGLKVVKVILKFLLENGLGLNSQFAHPQEDEAEVIEFLADVRKRFIDKLI